MRGTYGLEAINDKLAKLEQELAEARARIERLEALEDAWYPDEDHLDEAQPPQDTLERFREP